MPKRMLIDATHAEETRVVVLDGNRLEDFDIETAAKRQLKGNIYLAKVVRVEPSLQAAFVEYGGNRHGFLAFGEIHPDYYQIPVADRQRLLEMQAEEARQEEEAEDRAAEAEAAREAGASEQELAQPAEPNPLPETDPTKDDRPALQDPEPNLGSEPQSHAAQESAIPYETVSMPWNFPEALGELPAGSSGEQPAGNETSSEETAVAEPPPEPVLHGLTETQAISPDFA